MISYRELDKYVLVGSMMSISCSLYRAYRH